MRAGSPLAGLTGERSALASGWLGARARFGRGVAAELPGIYEGGSSRHLQPSGRVGVFLDVNNIFIHSLFY